MSSNIWSTQPRVTAQVKFSNGQVLEGPLNSKIEDFIKAGNFPPDPMPMACLVDGQLRELTYHANRDLHVHVLTLADSDGMRVYRRSLAFLLIAVAHELFPETQIIIDYGLNFGAFYCEVEGRQPFTEAELKQIENRMRELVNADLPVLKERIPLAEAEKLFKSRHADDKLRLLMHGYMVPSTRYLKYFAVDTYSDGFVLRYPRAHLPNQLQPCVEYPKLVTVFDEYGDWMTKLGVRDVGALNAKVVNNNLLETILGSEALQELRIAQIATLLASIQERVRLVLISGPSSSGKTTFSKRLAIQLLAHGIRPMALSLDDFIVDREKTPLDENGEYDFESIHALELKLFNDSLLRLMEGEAVTLPHYNFVAGKREWGETVSISDQHMIIVEGIHGMNPELVPHIPPKAVFRIYVSALTQLNLDRHNRVATTDTRLLRRVIRDARHRGYPASETINRWPKVRQGEYKWIFPYQENADVMFNSALVYELAIIKSIAEPLLLQIEPGKPEHVEAKRLLSFLQWFEPCSDELVPDNSLLREFIGGSILSDYKARG
jgi:uridine kinase